MQFLSLPKLAEKSGWSVTRVRRLVANRELPHIRVNGRLMLPANAIDEFVAKNFVPSFGEAEGEALERCQRGINAEAKGDAA